MTVTNNLNNVAIISYVCIWLLTGLLPYNVAPYLFLGLLFFLLYSYKKLLNLWFRQLTKIKILKGLGYAFVVLIFEGLGIWLALISNVSIKPINNNSVLIQEVLKNPSYISYISLTAPILEELVFRYALFNKFSSWISTDKISKMTRLILASILTSIIFSLAHGTLALPYIFMGLFLQWIYLKNDNGLVNMITHIMINLTTLILLI